MGSRSVRKNKEFVHQLNPTINMASSEEHTFENEWRRRFDEASETPPLAMWERIEARLDEEEEERVLVIPFWQRTQSLRWAAAAAVTALLLTLGGWWFQSNLSETPSKTATVVAPQEKTTATTTNELTQKSQEGEKIQNDSKLASGVIKENHNETEAKHPLSRSSAETTAATAVVRKEAKKAGQTPAAALVASASKKATSSKVNTSTSPENQLSASTPSNGRGGAKTEINVTHESETLSTTIASSEVALAASPMEPNTAPEMTLAFLEGKKMRELLGNPKRQPWVAPPSQPTEALKPKHLPKEYWASVGVMPASYNAGVEIGGRGALAAASNTPLYSSQATFNNSARTPTATNRSALSYAFQWQGGVQLSQRWSLESGVNYLQGNSIYQGVNAFSTLSNSYINSLETAINLSDNNIPRYDFATIGSDKSLVQTLSTSQDISNSYQFLQVPIQTGYALIKPKRKFSLWLLGGLINNIFLKNTFQTGQDNTVTVTGNDSPYRRLSFSATTGMRLQYKINKRWTTLLSGNYQRSVGSTTRAGAVFQARPQLMGVGAGVRYGF